MCPTIIITGLCALRTSIIPAPIHTGLMSQMFWEKQIPARQRPIIGTATAIPDFVTGKKGIAVTAQDITTTDHIALKMRLFSILEQKIIRCTCFRSLCSFS